MASDRLRFAIEVINPDPSSPRPRLRKAGLVLATFEGQEVGRLIYGVGPSDEVLLIRTRRSTMISSGAGA